MQIIIYHFKRYISECPADQLTRQLNLLLCDRLLIGPAYMGHKRDKRGSCPFEFGNTYNFITDCKKPETIVSVIWYMKHKGSSIEYDTYLLIKITFIKLQ